MSLPRRRLHALAACLSALCACALLASSPPASARRTPPAKFDVVKLAEGVYAAGPAVESAFNDATSKR